jgi:hypothetical protein
MRSTLDRLPDTVAYHAAVLHLLSALTASDADVAVRAPGAGAGYWAGGPSAVADGDGIWLAYRLRRPVDLGRGYANVVAHSSDGVHFDDVATVTSAQFGAASLERPALVRRPDGGWRLYVSCSTLGSKHWWVEAVDADTVAGLPDGKRTVVLPGDATAAWKDVVVRADDEGWQMWACRHPLDGGDDAADRMTTWYATSGDGLDWTLRGAALSPTPDTWDARGTRITDVLHDGAQWWALYDGRRTADENWFERSGLARGLTPDAFTAVGGPMPEDVGLTLRYATVVELAGGWRVYFEASASDGSNDLRTVYVPRPSAPSQSE